MKKFSKILSIFLTLALVLGMMTSLASADELTATLTASELGLSNTAAFTSATVDHITFTGAKGDNTDGNVPKYYTSGTDIRVYKGNTFTITPDSGYSITSIVLTCSSGYDMVKAVVELTNGKIDDSNANKIIPSDGTQAVTIKNTVANKDQLRIVSVAVTYTAIGGSETPDPNPNPDTPTTPETLTIADAIAMGEGMENNVFTTEKYLITGTVSEIKSTQWGNMNITDGTNTLYVYGCYNIDGTVRYDAMDPKPQVGDTVTLLAVVGNYNGAQLKNAWVQELIPGTGETPDPDPNPDTPTTPTEPSEPTTSYVTTPVVGESYKLGLHQTKDNAVYYFTGAMNGFYGATSTTFTDGVDVTVESAGEGKYYLSFVVEGAKKYIGTAVNDTHLNFVIVDEADRATFTWNDEYATFITVMDDEDSTEVFMGTHKYYKTVGLCDITNLSSADNYPVHLYKQAASSDEPTDPSTPTTPTTPSTPSTPSNPTVAGTPDDGEDDTTTPDKGEDDKDDEKPGKTEYTGTKLDSIKDGDKIVITIDGMILTNDTYLYTSDKGYTKDELVMADATFAGDKVTYKAGAIVLTVHVNGDKVSFTTPDGKYLYADGTNVKYVSEASEYTDFVLEQADGGYYIRCATATYNDKPQYLELYKGYLTCYSMGTNTSYYIFNFYAADPETPATGDVAIGAVIALLAVSGMGITVVLKKKNEF